MPLPPSPGSRFTPPELVALIRKAAGGDGEAQRVLLKELRPVIHARVARRLLRSAGGRDPRQERDDLVQDVLESLIAGGWSRLQQWDPERGASLANYVGLIAERTVSAKLRNKKQSPWTDEPTEADDLDTSLGLDQPHPGHEQQIIARDLFGLVLDRAHQQLAKSEKGLEMFHLVIVEGRSVEEVCAVMTMTPEAVYTWRRRLAAVLRTIADEFSSDPSGPPRTPAGRDAHDR
jgi:RNA polymerase sigma factor (sigma-70 family)